MTANQLKSSILQQAVQGKLVPQDPNDEPTSVLLERIRIEKDQMIKDGKIKKEKNPSYIFRGSDNLFYEKIGDNGPVCIDDEIPFEIPNSWEWTRLKSISILNPRNNVEENKDAAFIPMALLMDGYRNEFSYEIKQWGSIKTGFTHFSDGDIILAKITPCFQNRKSAIVEGLPNGIGAGTTELHVVRRIGKELSREYLLWLFKSSYFIDSGIKAFTGTAGQQRIGKDFLGNFLIPLPPLKEQLRIVNIISEVFPYIEKYDITENALLKLNNNFPEQLKNSVLQQAIQGKLVPQDPNDEPASVLLERIRTEKDQLVERGKIKRDKHESIIYRRDGSYYEKVDGKEQCIDAEIPFEIPDTWEWVRLKNICHIINGDRGKNYPSKNSLSPSGIPFISALNLDGKSIISDENLLCLTEEQYNKLGNGKLQKDDIVVCIRGSLGKHGRYPYGKGAIASSLVILRPIISNEEILSYILLYLDAPVFYQEIKIYDNGTAQPNLAAKDLGQFLFPLPPLCEQKRIVEKIKLVNTIYDDVR